MLALCPVPGYDRHFTLTEALGIGMTAIGMTDDGPDMDRMEALVESDPSVKCLWCVPKYSNPTGCVYSPDTVRRIARLPLRASEGFLVLWDNAYAVHDFDFPPAPLENVLECAAEAGTEDGVVLFGSTSKISFAGAGVGFVAGSPNTLDRLEARMSVMTVGHDKVNQLRHARFLGGRVREQMRAHAARVRPKFEAIERILSESLGGLGRRGLDTAPRRLLRDREHLAAPRIRGGLSRGRGGRHADARGSDASRGARPRGPHHPPGADLRRGRRGRGGDRDPRPLYRTRKRAEAARKE